MAEMEERRKELEKEEKKKKIQDDETRIKQRFKEKHHLENKLTKILPKILEVNLIAKELKRNISMVAKLVYSY